MSPRALVRTASLALGLSSASAAFGCPYFQLPKEPRFTQVCIQWPAAMGKPAEQRALASALNACVRYGFDSFQYNFVYQGTVRVGRTRAQLVNEATARIVDDLRSRGVSPQQPFPYAISTAPGEARVCQCANPNQTFCIL